MKKGGLHLSQSMGFDHEIYTTKEKENEKITFLIIGPSGSGKDTMVDMACKELNMKKVLSRTTREPRYVGENTHVFVSPEQALDDINDSSKIIAKSYYNNSWYYATEDDLENSDFYIIDFNGLDYIKTRRFNDSREYVVIFIDTDWQTRFWRLLKRDGLSSAINRMMVDSNEFKNKEKYKEMYKVKNYKEFKKIIKRKKEIK